MLFRSLRAIHINQSKRVADIPLAMTIALEWVIGIAQAQSRQSQFPIRMEIILRMENLSYGGSVNDKNDFNHQL